MANLPFPVKVYETVHSSGQLVILGPCVYYWAFYMKYSIAKGTFLLIFLGQNMREWWQGTNNAKKHFCSLIIYWRRFCGRKLNKSSKTEDWIVLKHANRTVDGWVLRWINILRQFLEKMERNMSLSSTTTRELYKYLTEKTEVRAHSGDLTANENDVPSYLLAWHVRKAVAPSILTTWKIQIKFAAFQSIVKQFCSGSREMR